MGSADANGGGDCRWKRRRLTFIGELTGTTRLSFQVKRMRGGSSNSDRSQTAGIARLTARAAGDAWSVAGLRVAAAKGAAVWNRGSESEKTSRRVLFKEFMGGKGGIVWDAAWRIPSPPLKGCAIAGISAIP
jgi:hypothetical protein